MRKRHRITLEFKTAWDKRYFLGQLSDGWGENLVGLSWPRGKNLCDVTVDDIVRVDPSMDREMYEYAKGYSQRMKELRASPPPDPTRRDGKG